MGNTDSSSNNTKKLLKEEYFQAINTCFQTSSEINNNNSQNFSICLDKKDFDSPVIARKTIYNSTQKYIYWKQYILCFLRRETEKGFQWAYKLHFSITGQDFFNETKWQNLFFYQEYKLLTQPKCLQNLQKASLVNKDISKTSNSNISLPYGFKSNFMGSFITTSNESFDVNDPLYDYQHFKHKIKQYIKFFQSHIFCEDHPIHFIVKEFVDFFVIDINSAIQQLKTSNIFKERKAIIDSIVGQLKRFLMEMQIVIKLFYSTTITFKFFAEEKDEFINLITSLVFNTDELYQKMFCLYELYYQKEINDMHTQMRKFEDISPDALGIQTQFCLDNSTRSFQLKLLKTYQESLGNNGINDEEDEEKSTEKPKEIIDIQYKTPQKKQKDKFKESKDSSNGYIDKSKTIESFNKEISIVSESQKLHAFSTKKENKKKKEKSTVIPFQNGIKLLQSLNKCKVPFEKMMVIATISAEITDSVNVYWREMEKVISPTLLNIDADQLMTIYIYIIIKSQLADLIIHSEFVRNFTTPMTRSTMMGYYFTTLEGSLNYILEIEDLNDFKRSDRKDKLITDEDID